MTWYTFPRCRHCGRRVEGLAVTKHGAGWMHTADRREKADDGHLAEPMSVGDMNQAHNRACVETQRRRKERAA